MTSRRAFFLQAAAPFVDQTKPAGKPNVIWLFGDQHRAQALATNGDPNAVTPNIDILANQGVNFTRAVSSFPLCCPFRGSLITGRYAHHCVPGHEYPLPDGQPTIAQPLKESGYHTAWFGKWHLSGWKERDGRGNQYIVPPARRGGFDTWLGYDNNNSQWDSWVHGGAGKDAVHYRLPGYETDALTDVFINYLKERGKDKKPFFAALSVQPPHDPYVAPAEWMRKYNPRKLELRPNVPRGGPIEEQARRDLAGYYAMIENWDWNVGRIRQALHEAGLGFNTHILFFSDHGDMHGSQGLFRKTNPFEESTRIPFLIGGEAQRYNGRVTGRNTAPINVVDIAPTTLGLCGIAKPGWMEGHDYSGARVQGSGTRAAPDSAFLQNVIPTGHGMSTNKPYRGIVTQDGWKYVAFENASWLLYNLNEDPYEMANQAHNPAYRAVRKKLLGRLGQWIADTGDKFALPGD
ncbi:MAG: sulfatase [Bryobacter sp.]|nr:sulfatase [Bryobacter sp.]